MTLRDRKRTLRDAMMAARDAIAPALRAERSRAIAARIADLDGYRRARVVLLTLPFRSEWDATLVARHALADGKTVAVPRVDPRTRMLEPLRIRSLDADVAPGYRGILEPRDHCGPIAAAAIEWVLVPGVAFDASGGRLGYGGGYYDRLLPLLLASAPRIAGAFESQIVDEVPAAPHDVRVDCIVTELRMLDCARTPA
jgi:5-formyltetrahydrofolate cyclo-ligase